MEKNYKFTHSWFNNSDFSNFISEFKEKEVHILEIGSFEGKSTVWFAENFMTNPNSTITCVDPWTSYSQDEDSFESYNKEDSEWDFKSHKNTFLYNIKQSGYEEQIKTIQGYSHEVLPNLLTNNEKYDIIFIDGNHTAPFVLIDSVFSWLLLKKDGLMIFDDYKWDLTPKEILRPKIAIDSFSVIFSDYSDTIFNGGKAIIKKLK